MKKVGQSGGPSALYFSQAALPYLLAHKLIRRNLLLLSVACQ